MEVWFLVPFTKSFHLCSDATGATYFLKPLKTKVGRNNVFSIKTKYTTLPLSSLHEQEKERQKKVNENNTFGISRTVFHPRSSFECLLFSPKPTRGGLRLFPPGLSPHDEEQTEASAVTAGEGNAASEPSAKAITFETHYLQFQPRWKAVAAARAFPKRPYVRVSAPAQRVVGGAAVRVPSERQTSCGCWLRGGVGYAKDGLQASALIRNSDTTCVCIYV